MITRLFVSLVLFLGLLFVFPSFVEVYGDVGENISGELNSFEIFWPVVAGKTKEDVLYPLKRLKEEIRGLFIFGAPEKAKYLSFLATKRLVEAEKLINNNRHDLAKDTLILALGNMQKVKEKVDFALEQGRPFPTIAGDIVRYVSNIELFSTWLSQHNEENSDLLRKIAGVANEIGDSLSN